MEMRRPSGNPGVDGREDFSCFASSASKSASSSQNAEYDEESSRQRLLLGGVVFGASVFGTLALTAPFVFTRSPLPYMATPGRKVYKALSFLNQKDRTRRPRTFVDMGSGDGEAVYQALQAGYDRAVGIELNYTLYAVAQMRRLFWTADERARSTFLRRNFFDYDLYEADAIMIFGVNPLMRALSEKLETECKAGACVLSYRFRLPTANASSTNIETSGRGNLLRASIIYNEEEMHIYECQIKV